jgi:hypothetical protein
MRVAQAAEAQLADVSKTAAEHARQGRGAER